jgi:hypothetical protein
LQTIDDMAGVIMRISVNKRTYLLGLVCAVFITPSCNETTTSAGPPATSAPPSTGAIESSMHAQPPQSLADAGMGRKTSVPDPDAVAISLTNITLTADGDHDQAVFEFAGSHIPGWAVQYVTKAVQNSTGDVLPIPGQSVLEVLVREAPSPFRSVESYAGPDVVSRPDTPQIQLVQYSAERLGITQAFIGVNGAQPNFAVSALTNPTRIVVDVAH